ncbi:DUF6542 domain-containing protein [Cumulibacter soli]|uniref:DUF6542 domain-containing protein n=1 Tax=Cumulibacter soli TaxID=2546344 RepID=UPI0010681658|nr:DUF6542 domain-containing protein [Cumulibacter soli]
MNNEQDREPTQSPSADGGRRSRWTVEPGSVSDSLSFRRPEGIEDQSSRRPAHEIIRELQQDHGVPPRRSHASAVDPIEDQATMIPRGTPLPPVPNAVGARPPRPDTPTRAGSTAQAAATAAAPRAKYASPRTEGLVAASRASATATHPRPSTQQESPRVKPDLGERRELRAATGGSSSALIMAGFGGVVLVAIGGIIGALLDYWFADRIGVVTAIGLALGAVIAALVTRKRDLISVIVAPPIVFAIIAGVVLLLSSKDIGITSIAELATRGFGPMALATGLAAIIGGIRLASSKAGDRR